MSAKSSRRRRAMTMLELLVVLTLLGIMAAVVGITTDFAIAPVRVDSTLLVATALRDSAIRSGTRLTTVVPFSGAANLLTALPDGRVISGDWLRVEQLTGRAFDAAR